MERKLTRSWSRFEEEESEEDMDRRSSTRINKGVNEQPGTSTPNSHNQRAQEQRCLPVSCGNKKGVLHIKKFKRGKACINSEDRWFNPRTFEVFGGKASNKKWKHSINHKNKPLGVWLEKASISTKVFKRRRTGTMKQKKILSPYRISESLSEEIQSAEETEKEEDEDWLPGSEDLAQETEEEEETRGARNGGEVDDSGVDESKEGEDEMEEEDTSAADDEEGETKVIISRSANGALQKKLKVAIERLPEATRDCQTNGMEHQLEAQSVVDCKHDNNDASISGHDAAQLQAMMLETRATQTCRPSESPQPSNMVEDLDTMDLDQLKREKIKMQLKVLKLQDQYYTLKIKEIKK